MAEPAALIVLADHDGDTRRMYAEYLIACGYHVVEAEDGRFALAKVFGERPDALVTETRLPGVSGFELCQLLRNDPQTAALPILCITSDSSPIERQRAETAGASAILVKPCLPEALCEEVDRLTSASEPVTLARAVGDDGNLNRAFKRMKTATPADRPPALACPVCAKPLVYEHRHIGGVNAKNAEQWDYYACTSGCGRFQFRHRTRKLKRVT